MTGPRKISEEPPDVLTGIPLAYTLGDNSEPESEEMNELIMKNFIDTLAEISLSIASRKVKEKE
jgi:hypothetical protein